MADEGGLNLRPGGPEATQREIALIGSIATK